VGERGGGATARGGAAGVGRGLGQQQGQRASGGGGGKALGVKVGCGMGWCEWIGEGAGKGGGGVVAQQGPPSLAHLALKLSAVIVADYSAKIVS